MNKSYLSKSQYMTGLQCEKALWLKKHRRNLLDDVPSSVMESGIEIGKLAQRLYPDGVLIDAKPWEYSQAIEQTEKAVTNGAESIYEAAAVAPDGGFSKADILHKDGNVWDIIEVKSSTKISPVILDDVAFQYYVFTSAGYKIGRCYVAHINNKYQRDGEVDVEQLFTQTDVTDEVLNRQNVIADKLAEFQKIKQEKDEPKCKIGSHCGNPYDCSFKDYCWQNVPDYSVFNVFGKSKAAEVAAQTGSYEVDKIPADSFPTGKKLLELKAYLADETVIDKLKVKEFLNSLIYPLYYLDYETIGGAIPLFDKLKPYQAVPFQFSLHVEEYAGSELKHVEFLHWQKGTDPRYDLAQKLVDSCGDAGSIIVYFESFEKSRNEELAKTFPEFADKINAINERIIDLYLPFKERHLYHPKQKGSASIKYVLPAFTDLSYEEMDIANGMVASQNYADFHAGKYPSSKEEKLFSDLIAYCELDTYAMVKLVRFLRGII